MNNITVIQTTITKGVARIRVAAYCRVSSDSADQINSFMAQVKYYENFLSDSITQQFVGIYADEGITGTSIDKRDEFKRLLHDCRKGKIDRIITKSISRFSRNTKDCLTSVRELKGLGISIMFEKENIDTANITDEMMITIMGGLAQEESVSISQNLRWGYQKRMQAGNVKSIIAPYGYKVYEGKLVVSEKEAEIVRYIFNSYLNGAGCGKICFELREKHIQKDEKGTIWYESAVRSILKNEKYIGDSMFQKKYSTDTLPMKKLRNKGEKDKFYATGTHLPIISKEDFDTVQEIMQDRRKKSSTQNNQINSLNKKILCCKCNSSFRRSRYNNIFYWTCRTHFLKASDCPIKQIPEQDIYNAFIRLHNKLKQNYKQILLPLRSQLQELNIKKFSGNNNVLDIHKEIA